MVALSSARRLAALVLLLAATLAFAAPPWGTGESRGEDLVISVIVFGPGDDIPSYFGHIAVAVEDTRLHESRLYNYGMFSFDNAMILKFIRGRLEFWVGEDDVDLTLRFYRYLNRDVTIQVLNLSPEARLKLARALATNVLPENRNYLYNHYFDNCSTRPRDLIDQAVGGQLMDETTKPGRWTLRQHTRRFGWVDPFINVAMDFGLNDQVDKPLPQFAEAFLPAELQRQLAHATYLDKDGHRVPLVARTIEYYRSNRPPTPEKPPDYTLALLLLGLSLGLVPLLFGLVSARWPTAGRVGLGVTAALLGFLVGFLGLLLAFLWCCTNHTIAYHNENLFLASPLALAALPFGISVARGRRPDAPRRLTLLFGGLLCLALLGAALKVLPWFDQRNGPFFALFLPTLVGLAGGAWLLYKGPHGSRHPRAAR